MVARVFWIIVFPFIVAGVVGLLIAFAHMPGTIGEYMAVPAALASFILTLAAAALVRRESI